MDSFAFHPELLEERTRVMEELSAAGFEWLSDYGAVDMLHDVYGLEVTGVREEADCRRIAQMLARLYPRWKYTRVYYKDRGAETGWKAVVHRDPESDRDSWKAS